MFLTVEVEVDLVLTFDLLLQVNLSESLLPINEPNINDFFSQNAVDRHLSSTFYKANPKWVVAQTKNEMSTKKTMFHESEPDNFLGLWLLFHGKKYISQLY